MSDVPAGPRRAVGDLLPEEVYLRALEVGRSSAGISGPNPPVGCVIVRDGRIVGEGATRPVGGAHAEIVALASAGLAAQGAVAVVTLEPCAHHGRTPPCTDALVAAGVAEVHVLQRDPHPEAGGGVERLRAAGVHVVDGASVLPRLADRAAHDLRGFLARVAHARPHVHLKLAQGVDGRTLAESGRYLTGASARARVHRLRADVDAVLVGGATVRDDDPRLDVRLAEPVRQPRPVILSVAGDLPSEAAVLRPGAVVVVGPDVAAPRVDRWRERGVDVVVVPLDDAGELDLSAALASLLERRILTVLAEPGPRLAEALIAQRLVDVIELHVAGGAAADPGVVRPAIAALAPLVEGRWDVARSVTDDGDVLLRADAAQPMLVPQAVR